MQVTVHPSTGNSSKFKVVTKRGDFLLALSFTLRKKIWQLEDAATELNVATQLAEAVVSRHDPETPFKTLYIFAEHNCEPSAEATIQKIRVQGYKGK